MPIFEFQCRSCGSINELILITSQDNPVCPDCKSIDLEKLISAHATISGHPKQRFPAHDDTACCGSDPDKASHCAGPGSCCGRSFDR